MKTKYTIGILATIALATGSMSFQAQAQYVGPTNKVVYDFNTNQVTGTWGNWFGNDFVGVGWDASVDSSNNPSSGSMVFTNNPNSGFAQFVLYDGNNPSYTGLPLVGNIAFTNLSFDMRYDISSGIRTNANGSLDFGTIRAGSRGGDNGFAQQWYYYWSVPATNGAGLPNTNWVHISINLNTVPTTYPELGTSGLFDTLIGADNGNYNPTLHGQQIIWFDNIQYSGWVAPIPPPTMSIAKTIPSLTLFGGSGLYGRSQVALVDTNESWIGGTFPVSYSFTILDNATSPGRLQTGIQFIGGNPGNASFWDYGATNVLWLEIISGTGTNTACVADISWKTNYPNHNPPDQNTALRITNSVLAGTWTLTFNSDTTGTLTAPGASPVPFTLALSDADAITYFSNPIQVRFGHENYGNTANGGVPHYWSNISVSGTAGTHVNEDFTRKGSTQLDTNIWNLNTSDGVGVINLVPTNAPYWVKWTTPDTGFTPVSGGSLSNIQNWEDLAVNPITQGGVKWALIQQSALPAGNASFFALNKRGFVKLQILLPGETNAPGTVTGKIGTPYPVSFETNSGIASVTINAVDSTYHIAKVSGDMIKLTTSDTVTVPPDPAALVNGTVTQQLQFSSMGNFTITATDTTNTNIPPVTSPSVSVVP